MKSIQQILQENTETLYYKKDLSMIKKAWLNNISQFECESMFDLYYLGMAKVAVCLLNKVSYDLFLNHHCHKGNEFEKDIADNRARDLCELFRYDLIGYNDLIYFLQNYSDNEKYYFLVRLVYPNFLFENRFDTKYLEDYLPVYRQKIKQVIDYFNNQIYIPSFVW